LLNPNNTTAVLDSTTGYEKITIDNILNYKFSSARDAIGYNWKFFDRTGTALYTTDKMKTYIIRNRNNKYWKLHFLDFYNSAGVKGSPSFEFERLQ
jgi:hypothetical protein